MVTTSYGKVLLLKAAAIGMMLPLSWSAWRRRVFRRAEGAVAAAVVTIAAVLSVLPVPNTPAHGSAQQRASALPRPGELTLGGDAGQFLVGLSLQPAKPGNDLVLVYLQPIEGSGAGVPVRLFIGGRSIPTGECGTNCRSARLIIQGGERIALNIGGPKGGKAVFEIPRLPPADGSPILELMQRRMHALRSLRIHETLSSGLGGTVTAEYSLQAPDRMEIVVQEGGSGSHTVWIGGTRYLKQGLHGQWHVERGGLSTQVPSFIWDYFQPFRDARVVGGQSVNGVPTRIVAFYGESGGTPVWFRLWIDRSGLVRRDEMRAFGHFMNHRYYGFDRPVTIRPPVKG